MGGVPGGAGNAEEGCAHRMGTEAFQTRLGESPAEGQQVLVKEEERREEETELSRSAQAGTELEVHA